MIISYILHKFSPCQCKIFNFCSEAKLGLDFMWLYNLKFSLSRCLNAKYIELKWHFTVSTYIFLFFYIWRFRSSIKLLNPLENIRCSIRIQILSICYWDYYLLLEWLDTSLDGLGLWNVSFHIVVQYYVIHWKDDAFHKMISNNFRTRTAEELYNIVIIINNFLQPIT